MCMTDGSHVGSRLMQRRVQQQRRGVHRPSATEDLSPMVDLNQLAHCQVPHRDSDWIHPEAIGELRVTQRDVAE